MCWMEFPIVHHGPWNGRVPGHQIAKDQQDFFNRAFRGRQMYLEVALGVQLNGKLYPLHARHVTDDGSVLA